MSASLIADVVGNPVAFSISYFGFRLKIVNNNWNQIDVLKEMGLLISEKYHHRLVTANPNLKWPVTLANRFCFWMFIAVSQPSDLHLQSFRDFSVNWLLNSFFIKSHGWLWLASWLASCKMLLFSCRADCSPGYPQRQNFAVYASMRDSCDLVSRC